LCSSNSREQVCFVWTNKATKNLHGVSAIARYLWNRQERRDQSDQYHGVDDKVNAYVAKTDKCINCGAGLFETNELLSKMEGHTIWSHLEDTKCDDPLTREEEQRSLWLELETNPHVQLCSGCKKNLTIMYSDDYPWCCECENSKDISAYNWHRRD
jgi:hypothetical protein